ncbi:MAG: glycosyltransferase [Actinophytocola sp.]|nr:glycosyltransferase [Actinophytocola sp.]
MKPRSQSLPEGAGTDDDKPGVSVIMTVLNEEQHMRSAVEAVLRQDYPGPFELIMALGPSDDATDEIAASIATEDERVTTVANPAGATPIGLNRAIKKARHDILVRVDGHCVLPPDYVSTAVEVLEQTGADNVGGSMDAEGTTPFERAVARATNSWLGVGGARFHVGGSAGPAETVYLGSFRRSALERVGGYDEAMRRAQDWELNYRLRRSGGTVWFTPEMRVAYRPRPNIRKLAKQYFQTGQWRRAVVRRHRETLNLRYLAPPLAVLGVVSGTAAGVAGFAPALILPGGYAVAIIAGSTLVGRGLPANSRARLPLVCATMHMAWGAGFLFSPRRLR